MAQGKFGTAINCMDGRVQLPMIDWMKDNFGVDYVDMVTEPGADKVVTSCAPEALDRIIEKVRISVEKHGSRHVVITGHDDCAGHPVSKEQHIEDIRKAMQIIKGWNLPVTIYGVWINSGWQVELIDTIEMQ
jgi:carbonic anhydrase